MKSSFSLIETLIATVLLTGTIAILIESKNFNLNLLSSMKNKTQYDSLISVLNVSKLQSDKKVYFTDLLELKDDDIRAKLKDERIEFKIDQTDILDIDLQELPLSFSISQESYKSEKYGTKRYYRVSLNE